MDLSGNKLSPSALGKSVLKILSGQPRLSSFTLRSGHLRDFHLASLFQNSGDWTSGIQVLDLSNNSICDQGCAILANAFGSKLNCITELNLSGNTFRDEGCILLLQGMQEAELRIRTLDLSRNSIGSGSRRKGRASSCIQSFLTASQSLSHLILSNCNLGMLDIHYIGQGMTRSPNLLSIHLDKNLDLGSLEKFASCQHEFDNIDDDIGDVCEPVARALDHFFFSGTKDPGRVAQTSYMMYDHLHQSHDIDVCKRVAYESALELVANADGMGTKREIDLAQLEMAARQSSWIFTRINKESHCVDDVFHRWRHVEKCWICCKWGPNTLLSNDLAGGGAENRDSKLAKVRSMRKRGVIVHYAHHRYPERFYMREDDTEDLDIPRFIFNLVLPPGRSYFYFQIPQEAHWNAHDEGEEGRCCWSSRGHALL